jgi:hypothetical protein
MGWGPDEIGHLRLHVRLGPDCMYLQVCLAFARSAMTGFAASMSDSRTGAGRRWLAARSAKACMLGGFFMGMRG